MVLEDLTPENGFRGALRSLRASVGVRRGHGHMLIAKDGAGRPLLRVARPIYDVELSFTRLDRERPRAKICTLRPNLITTTTQVSIP